jgi:hypothetical protein
MSPADDFIKQFNDAVCMIDADTSPKQGGGTISSTAGQGTAQEAGVTR